MGDAPLILGVSGLRGIVGESLTPEVAVRYAAAFGAWLEDQIAGQREPLVMVARDGRAGGEAVYTAVISALLATGCRVRRLGIAMTPSAGVVTDSRQGDACLIITASHNPQEWNGIKILLNRRAWELGDSDARGGADGVSDACAPDAETAQEIIDAFHAGRCSWAPQHHVESSSVDDDVEDTHCLRTLNAAERVFDVSNYWDMVDGGVRTVVVDAVNASGVNIDDCFFDDTPVQMIAIAGGLSGIFPHIPEPTAENLSGAGGLCDAVPGLKADVGFAQDPDGDRLAIVDERGRYIGEEYTLAIAAEAILGAMQVNGELVGGEDPSPRPSPPRGEGGRGDPHAGREREESEPRASARAGRQPVLVTNLSTSRMIEDVAAAYGARVERTAVGEANVVERMKALKAAGEHCVLGGEGNGGVIWPEVTYVRDSLGAMALTLGLMAREGKTVSEIVSKINGYARGGGYAIVKRKQALASKPDAEPAVRRIADRYAGERVDTQDGVRVDFDAGERAGSWVHVRASNTEPILRLIGEAADETAAGALLDEVAGIVNES